MSTEPAVGALGWIREELDAIRAANQERVCAHMEGGPGPTVRLGDRELIHLCSNNYLGLAYDERVIAAAAEALARYGAGAGGSRLVSGGSTVHEQLEALLAASKSTEDAILFSSGYLANIGTIPALVSSGDAIFSDSLNHASIIDGCRMSRAEVVVYRHADPDHLERQLRACRARRKLVVTESVFSMDGDLAPLVEISAVCERYGAMLMVDEAHAAGLLGPNGGGGVERCGLTGRVPIVMGTLSKALGSAGGYVAGSSNLINLLRNRARSFIFDTAPPPSSAAAAIEALKIAAAEPWRRERALDLAQRLTDGVRAVGFSVRPPTACAAAVVLGAENKALRVARRLLEDGILAPAIRPPSVPDGSSRIRITTMATHTDDHIRQAIEAFRALGEPSQPDERQAAGGTGDHQS